MSTYPDNLLVPLKRRSPNVLNVGDRFACPVGQGVLVVTAVYPAPTYRWEKACPQESTDTTQR